MDKAEALKIINKVMQFGSKAVNTKGEIEYSLFETKVIFNPVSGSFTLKYRGATYIIEGENLR